MHVDADPANGTAPCEPIDANATKQVGEPFHVAICLDQADGPPISGGLSVAILELAYSAPLDGVSVPSDLTADLDGNPDWKQENVGGGGAWTCNVLNLAESAPIAGSSSAQITCTTVSYVNQPVASVVHLADLIFLAPASTGISQITWGDVSALLAGNIEVGCAYEPADKIDCVGATIDVEPAVPTSTPEPAATHTPTPTATPTATPTPCGGDADCDGLTDAYEAEHPCLKPNIPDAGSDPDRDTLTNAAEQGGGTDPCDVDSDDDGVKDRVEIDFWGTDPLDADSDNDGIPDRDESSGGCGLAGYDLSKGDGIEAKIGFGDFTHPMHAGTGLDCDADQDNDGVPDANEPSGSACGGLPSTPGGTANISVDDDHDGLPAVGFFGGTDVTDDGIPWDSDLDGQIDGFECANGFDPDDPASRDPGNLGGGICGRLAPGIVAGEWSADPQDPDADNDGLLDSWEVCKWGTDPADVDSDGDGLGDCREAIDIDGSGLPNISDVVIVAKSALLTAASFGRDWVYDVDGGGAINITDAFVVAQLALTAPGTFCN
ncbi:MAG: hypothetical protein WEC75_08985 [Dehalococcoidia bacterium]